MLVWLIDCRSPAANPCNAGCTTGAAGSTSSWRAASAWAAHQQSSRRMQRMQQRWQAQAARREKQAQAQQ